MHSFFKPNNKGDFNIFKDDIITYKKKRANWGWGVDEFAGFDKFDAINSTTFATPFIIMFGPDKCGANYKYHVIFRYKNPITGVYHT